LYNNFKHQVMEGVFNLLTDTVKVGLLNAYTPNIDTHTTWAEAIAGATGECAGSGYTAGGETLGSKTVVLDSANDRGVFDGANVTWTALLLSTPASHLPSHAVMYSTTASNLLIAYWVLGTTVTNGGDYTLAWNATGIITLT
jgi:hypothetical protein